MLKWIRNWCVPSLRAHLGHVPAIGLLVKAPVGRRPRTHLFFLGVRTRVGSSRRAGCRPRRPRGGRRRGRHPRRRSPAHLANGTAASFWSPDGRRLLFLHHPARRWRRQWREGLNDGLRKGPEDELRNTISDDEACSAREVEGKRKRAWAVGGEGGDTLPASPLPSSIGCITTLDATNASPPAAGARRTPTAAPTPAGAVRVPVAPRGWPVSGGAWCPP